MLEVGCLEACVFNKSKIQVVHWCKPYTTYGIDTSHRSLKFQNMNKIQSNSFQSIMVVLASQIAKEKKKMWWLSQSIFSLGNYLQSTSAWRCFTLPRESRISPPPWSSCKWICVKKLSMLNLSMEWSTRWWCKFTISFWMHHTKPFVIHVWLANMLPNKGCVTHCVALPFTLKSLLRRQKKIYGNSTISPCKNIIFQKSSKRNQNPSKML